MKAPQRAALALAAFLSGASALGLQLAWTRRLAVALGHEWPATLAVFTAFFLGMAAGAWGLSGPIRQSRRPWMWLAGLEAVVGAWALVSIPWLRWLGEAATTWSGAEPGWLTYGAMSAAVTAFGLLPATVAMGATFAAFERTWAALDPQPERCSWEGSDGAADSFARRGVSEARASSRPVTSEGRSSCETRSSKHDRSNGIVPAQPGAAGGHVGTLYGWNTAGAMSGVLLGLGWLQPTLGLAGATTAAALGHFLAGIAGGWAGRGPTRGDEPGEPRPSQGDAGRVGVRVWLGLGGFLGMALEVVGIRLLAPVLGGTVYSQALVLGVWLAGTAAGATPWVRGGLGRGGGAGLALGWVGAAAWAAWAMDRGAAWVMAAEMHDGFWMGCLREGALVMAVMGPMSAVSSAWFVRGMERALGSGMDSGRALGWNVLGAALAPCTWGTVAVPMLGERGAWTALLAAGLALGLGAGLGSGMGGARRWMLGGLAAAAMAAGLVPGLDLASVPPGARRVRHAPGMSDTVDVWEWPDRSRTLAVNRRMTMGGTATAAAAARHAHVPLLLHPAPRRALFLGVGTGISFAAAGLHPGLRAEGVELVPEVVGAMGEFAPENTLGPGLRVVTADARRFVRAAGDSYDVIVADLFHPERDGAAWLYTEEHFRAMRSRLAADGVACQWLPWFQLDARSRASVVGAWLRVFPGSEAWLLRWTTLDTPVVGLIHGAGRVGPWDWDSRVGTGPLREALRRSGLTDGWQWWGCWAGPASSLATGNARRNTDDAPAVLWMAARGVGAARDESRPGLLAWLEGISGGRPSWALERPEEGGRWDRMRQARDAYLRGLDAVLAGKPDAGHDALWESVTLSADFPTGYSHWLGEAMAMAARDPAHARGILERLARERPSVPVAREVLRRLEATPKAP